VLGALNMAALVLAIRINLLVAVTGGIALTYLALNVPDPWKLIALGIYTFGVVVPCIWLTSKRG
jgi:hypothetical protein